MHTKSRTISIFGLILSLALLSCESHVEEDALTELNGCETSFSFTENITPIIDSYCVECHMGTQFPDLRTHESIEENAAIIQSEVVNRTMPIGGSLTNDQIEMINCWIEAGALNN